MKYFITLFLALISVFSAYLILTFDFPNIVALFASLLCWLMLLLYSYFTVIQLFNGSKIL